MGVDEAINEAFAPIAAGISEAIFFSVSVGGSDLQLIVLWLVAGALFFTFYACLVCYELVNLFRLMS